MSRHHKPKAFWRLARIWFRHVRITVWLVILCLLLALVYLHHIGLPGFAQRAVIGAFAARGITLSFSQLHLSWIQGIVAEEVSLQPAGSGWVPRIECQKVDLNFNPLEALRLRIVPESLSITEGRLILPYPQTNGLPGELTATHLQARIRFERGAGMSMDSLQGEVAGCNFSASGTAANLHRIQDWRLLQQRVDQPRGPAYEIWQTVSRIRNDIICLTPPEVRVEFDVDGAAPERLALRASLKVDAATSPLGMLVNPEVTVRVNPMDDGTCSEVEILAQVDRIATEFGRGENVILESTFSCVAEAGTLLAGRTALSARELATHWVGAVDLKASVGWSCDGTNPIPVTAELDLGAAELSTPSAWAHGVRVGLRLTPFLGDHRRIPELPRFIFAGLEPFALDGSLKTERVETPWLSITNLELAGSWSAPELAVTDLSVACAGGHLEAGVEFDATSGRLQFRAFTDLDPKRFYPVLPQEAVDWLEFFTYVQAPVANGIGAITLPEWRPYDLRWPGDLLPSLVLNGEFSVGEGTYRRIPLSGASSHFTYSNMCWHLPDLTLRSPDGSLRLEHHNNDRTSEFIWKVDGAMDPTPALILIPEDALETRAVLNTLRFGTPPQVHLTLSGRWSDPKTLQGRGTVHASDLAFRGQSMDELEASLELTNLTLTVNEPHVKTSQGEAGASSLTFNLLENRAFLSNGVSTLPPMMVATAIGSDVVRAIEPYRFLNPPKSRVEGFIPLTGAAEPDLRFDLKGGPFEWMTFELSEVDARVHWKGDTVAINIQRAGFYDGTASGQAFFDFTQTKDADFRFNLRVENADMRPLVGGVFQSTNQLEGRLSGGLSITNANTGDFQSWFGYGQATLRDGFLWSVPIFGIVSPVLEVLVPGLGNSRAKEAEGQFTITNSVIRTDDLVIHSSNMRLLYTGTVDFQGQVEAVAEAEILRDTLVVGEIVSLALTPLSKAMITEITGTLSDPKARPFYLLPRVILAPLNPVRFFRDMFAPPAPQYEELPLAAPGETETAVPDPPPAS